MPTIKKLSDGEYYLCTIYGKKGLKGKRSHRNIHLVKCKSNGKCGFVLRVNSEIITPKELIGKRIRLKIEIVE